MTCQHEQMELNQRNSMTHIQSLQEEVNQLSNSLNFAMERDQNMRKSLQSRKSETTIRNRLSDFELENLQERLRES